MTLLADLAAVSRRVADTPSRLEKIRELAGYLRGLAADEIPIAIAFLSGETRRGKLGVAYAALHGARKNPLHVVLEDHQQREEQSKGAEWPIAHGRGSDGSESVI